MESALIDSVSKKPYIFCKTMSHYFILRCFIFLLTFLGPLSHSFGVNETLGLRISFGCNESLGITNLPSDLHSQCRLRSYNSNVCLYGSQSQLDSQVIYFLIAGTVEYRVILPIDKWDDSTVVPLIKGPGSTLRSNLYFGIEGHDLGEIWTTSPCRVCQITLKRLKEYSSQSAEHAQKLIWNFAKQQAQDLELMNQEVKNLVFLDVSGRIAKLLLDMANGPTSSHHPLGRLINVKSGKIAKRIGASRSFTSRIINKMISEGLLQKVGPSSLVVVGQHVSSSPKK